MDWALGFAFRGVVRLVSHLPLARARQLLRGLSGLQLAFNTHAARTTRTNLALCFPDLDASELRDMVRRSLAETACIVAELGMLFHWPQQRWLALAKPLEAQALQQALASKSGVLVLVPHFGNWEYLALYLGQFGVMGLYDPPRIKSLEVPLRKARERSGVAMLPMDKAGLRAAYRHLQGGNCLALLPDQVPRRTAGVYAPFFGRPALTMNFAHRLIQRTRPIVLLGMARRVPSGFHVRFVPLGAGPQPAEGIYAPSAEASATALNRAIEELVGEDPAQYQWEYKRFRRQPKGSVDFYDE